MNEMNYQHAEAFALMAYQCEKCGRRERIWNSRDGVTPFITSCPREGGCGGSMQHVDWQNDRRVVGYEPQEGERFFRDGTDEEARRSVAAIVDDPEHPCPEGWTRADLIESMLEGYNPGWPKLEMVPVPVEQPPTEKE